VGVFEKIERTVAVLQAQILVSLQIQRLGFLVKRQIALDLRRVR
jgi:hypothetical protein